MDPTWKHADVFPIIARIIEAAYRDLHKFITAQEIAARLLQDTEARNLVEAARDQQEEKQSLEWLASNMVSWFSQRITVGESEWARAFERTTIDGLWASCFGRSIGTDCREVRRPLAKPQGACPRPRRSARVSPR
jgi:hypothetical protein